MADGVDGVVGVDGVAGTDGVVCAVGLVHVYLVSIWLPRESMQAHIQRYSHCHIPNFVGFNSSSIFCYIVRKNLYLHLDYTVYTALDICNRFESTCTHQ